MQTFEFKKFKIFDNKSTMKVGTDAILLGSFSSRNNFIRALDIGTGCGIIALMLAQNSIGKVLAIDVDHNSVEQANNNFSISSWSSRLSAQCVSAQELHNLVGGIFDKIVSNPPFFSHSLKSNDSRRNLARHDVSISFEDLADVISLLLCSEGVFDIILPINNSIFFESILQKRKIFISEEMLVFSSKNKPIRRILSFSRKQKPFFEYSELTLLGTNKQYSEEYKDFTKDFFLNL